jgi:outer membrane receptor for ferrienterochelin and colicins
MEDTLEMKNRNSFIGSLVCTGILILGLLMAPLRVWAQETEEAEGDLGEIKVTTSTKTEREVDEVPVVVEVITKEELEQANVKTVREALEFVVGVNPTGEGTWGTGAVEMRGMESSHTLILLDGQRFCGGHDAVSLESISVEMIEQIEIVKGPVSSLYGSDAMGGVINIITKKSAAKSYGNITAEGGSSNTRIYKASTGFGNEKYNVIANYTHNQGDGVDPELDAYDEDIFNINLGLTVNPQSKLEATSYFSRYDLDDDGRSQERSSLNLKWKQTVDELSNWYLRGSVFTFKHWTEDRSTDYQTDSYEGEAGYSRLFGAGHLVTAGLQYHLEKSDDNGKDYTADQTTNALFIQDEIELGDFQVILGTRVDDHELWGTEINPNASIAYRVTEKSRLRASVAKAFSAPNLVKLYGEGWRMGPHLVHANPDLEPEESLGYQLGWDYRFNERISLRATLFQNDIDNLITYRVDRTTGYPYGMYWENTDEAMTRGVELNLRAKLSKTLSGTLGYTRLDTEDKETGLELASRPQDSVNLTLDWQAAPKWQVRLSGLLTGKRYEDEENENKLGSYFLLNLGLEHKLTDNYRLFFKADNVTGVEDIEDDYDLDGVKYYLGVKARIKN